MFWNNPGWLADDLRRGEDLVSSRAAGLYTNKYKDTSTLSDASPLLRYAEVLLNRAEAKARLNDPTYLADLNAVRNRSLANPAAQAYAAFPNRVAAVNAILLERRIEFLAEGLRWNTIHRLQQDDVAPINGIPGKYRSGSNPTLSDYNIGTPYVLKAGDVVPISYSSDIYLWPIPTLETSANPVLAEQQNPGY